MNRKLVIFDMDGTILDTLEDLKDALNHVLTQHSFPIRTLDEVRRFVGNGIYKLIERGVPAGTPRQEIDAVYEDFKPTTLHTAKIRPRHTTAFRHCCAS